HGARGRRDVDDAPAALLPHHQLARRPRHQEGALEIRLDHPVPVLVLHANEESVASDAGVVDEDVEPAEPLLGGLHQTVGVFALDGIGHHAVHRSAALFELLGRALHPVGIAARHYHGRSVLCQQGGRRVTDAPAAAGHDRDLAAERGCGHAAASAARALSRPAGSSTLTAGTPSAMRLASPVSTRPGPTSTNAVAPSDASPCTHAVQRTGLATWRRRNGTTSAAVRVRPASTLRTTGILGSLTVILASSAASRSAAGDMSAQWNGALTGSSTLLRPPRSLASATARSTAVLWPAMTICCSEFTLAMSTTSPLAASAHTCSTTPRPTPITAAMAPVPTGTAACMNSPRRRTTRTASASDSVPATTSAEYSPRLWPAASAGFIPRSAQAAAAAALAVSTAGCVLAVSASSVSGPSNITRRRSMPSASLASSITRLAAGDAS